MTEDEKTAQIINALFEKIIRIKPAFKQGWPTETEFQMAKREWVNAFRRANITSLERVKRGIERLTDSEKSFIPSPGEFLALCRLEPGDVGAPPIEQAYKEAIKNAYPDGLEKRWSHPCVRHAFQQSGAFEMRTEPKSKTQPLFEKNYLDSLDDYAEGKILEQVAHDKPKTQGRYAPVTGFGGYEWAKPGIMKQYECIKSYEDAMDVIENICKLNPKMRPLKRAVQSLKPT